MPKSVGSWCSCLTQTARKIPQAVLSLSIPFQARFTLDSSKNRTGFLRGEVKRADGTITASVTRSGYDKMTKNWIYSEYA